MSFQLSAPYPALQTTSLLPSPLFSNTEATTHDQVVKRGGDGTRYTYVRKKTRRKLVWNFRLDRAKGLELRAFLNTYFASQIQITDHEGEVWLGYLTNNPFELSTDARSAPAGNVDGVAGERQTITLEFEGVLQ